MQVDDGAEVTTTQAMLGKVSIQDDGVEQVEHGLAGEGGDEVGEILAVGNHPDRQDVSLSTRRSTENSTDFELESERAGLARIGVAESREVEQGVAEDLPLVGGEAERDEEDGLETPNWMGWRQQVITNLRLFANTSVGIRKAHHPSVLRICACQQGSALSVRPTYRR